MIFKAISAFSVIAFSSVAFSATHITCSGSALHDGKVERTVSISAEVVSPQVIQNVSLITTWFNDQKWTSANETMTGVEDSWEMSPQQGTRFYFHSGNTSEFLIIEKGVLDSVIDKSGVHFSASEIFESYEPGDSQVISQLDCVTL